ncbi:MAG: hypothetical protein R2712_09670 [Vicinamibacterales bacterium]
MDLVPGAVAPPVDPADLRLRRWNNEERVFEAAAWTPELTAMRPVLAEHFGQIRVLRQGGNRFRREASVSFSVNDDYTLVSPVTLFEFPEDRGSAPRIDILGFTLIRIDPEYVTSTLLPSLTARHFHGEDGPGSTASPSPSATTRPRSSGNRNREPLPPSAPRRTSSSRSCRRGRTRSSRSRGTASARPRRP